MANGIYRVTQSLDVYAVNQKVENQIDWYYSEKSWNLDIFSQTPLYITFARPSMMKTNT